jgi:Mn-dependent DtxR family transcriptional regulator
MGFSNSSVSHAVEFLKKGGFVVMDNDSYLSLTKKGKEVAEKIYEHHTVITEFLVNLVVDKETAAEGACKMEHDISNSTINAIKKFVNG